MKATYRRGIGLDGLVRAGQLSTLLTRPPGLKSAINPLAAEGADEPESFANAQQNAPLTVLTLDRVVSLEDYENFSRAYAGIAKALATWTWEGNTPASSLRSRVRLAPGFELADRGSDHGDSRRRRSVRAGASGLVSETPLRRLRASRSIRIMKRKRFWRRRTTPCATPFRSRNDNSANR